MSGKLKSDKFPMNNAKSISQGQLQDFSKKKKKFDIAQRKPFLGTDRAVPQKEDFQLGFAANMLIFTTAFKECGIYCCDAGDSTIIDDERKLFVGILGVFFFYHTGT